MTLNVSVILNVSAALPPVQVTVPVHPDSDEVQVSPASSSCSTTVERVVFAAIVVIRSAIG